MFENRLIRFDEQTVPNTKFNDLNPKLWKRFRTVISPTNDQEFLEKMKLITRDEDSGCVYVNTWQIKPVLV